MTKENFERYCKHVLNNIKKTAVLYHNGIDMVNFSEDLDMASTILLKECFGDENAELIEQFLFEIVTDEKGLHGEYKTWIWDDKREPLVGNFDSLCEFLNIK